MLELEVATLKVKGFRSGLQLKAGHVHLWNKSAGGDNEFPVSEIIGVEHKKAGLTRGWLAVRTIDSPGQPSGGMDAMSHPMTVVLSNFAGSAAKKFVDMVDGYLKAHPPAAEASPYRVLGVDDKATQKQLDAAVGHLDRGETIHAVVLGAYETEILGADSARKGILMASDSRLIFFARKMGGYDLESFFYDSISSFEQSKGMTGGKLTFFASGNKAEVKWIHKGDLQGFVDFVRAKMANDTRQSASGTAQVKAPSAADQIRELGKLREEGLITGEEFAAKKRELLGL